MSAKQEARTGPRKLKPIKVWRPTKITKSQLVLLAQLLVHFSLQHEYALRRRKPLKDPDGYIHPISLTNLYTTLKVHTTNKPVVHFAARVFFERAFRGNSVTKKCSGWRVRERPHVNAQLLKLLQALFEMNRDHIQDLRTVVCSPSSDGTVSLSITTTFNLPSEDAKQLKLIVELMNGEDTAMKEAA